MNLTPFGKQARKYRIDAGTTLGDMADELDLSAAYLSAVETGRKAITDKVVAGAINYFRKYGIDASDLEALADRSRETVNLHHLDEVQKMAAAAFARKLPEMDGNADQLREFLEQLLNKKV